MSYEGSLSSQEIEATDDGTQREDGREKEGESVGEGVRPASSPASVAFFYAETSLVPLIPRPEWMRKQHPHQQAACLLRTQINDRKSGTERQEARDKRCASCFLLTSSILIPFPLVDRRRGGQGCVPGISVKTPVSVVTVRQKRDIA